MKPLSILLSFFLLCSSLANSYGFEPLENTSANLEQNNFTHLIDVPEEVKQGYGLQRYLVFGHGLPEISSEFATISRVTSNNGFFSVSVLPENSIPMLNAKGYHVIRDVPLDFYSTYDEDIFSSMGQIRKYTGSDLAQIKYNYTGNGIKIAIVDTGVDFSNPDLKDSLARDQNNIPKIGRAHV